MIQPVVEMKDVVKFYASDKPVLNGVSFRLFHGETKIIIGTSGSGKSTILKLIMGLDKPDEGQILVEGQDIAPMTERVPPTRCSMMLRQTSSCRAACLPEFAWLQSTINTGGNPACASFASASRMLCAS